MQVHVLPRFAVELKGCDKVPPIAVSEHQVAKRQQQGANRFHRSTLARDLVYLLLQPFDGIS